MYRTLIAFIAFEMLLTTGCATLTGGSANSAPATVTAAPAPVTSAEAVAQDRKVDRERFGDWNIACLDNPVNFSSHCRAQTRGAITEFRGDPGYGPNPNILLWVSWIKGQPKDSRSICVFGENYPVEKVTLQIDARDPVQLEARNVSGCFVANDQFLQQMRNGSNLFVTFQRWPWGQAKAVVSLKKSSHALKELSRLVAER